MGEKDLDQMEAVNLENNASSCPPPPPSDSCANNTTQPTATPPNELVTKLLGVFAASGALAIFLWFMVGAGFPWFIYIIYAVSLINSIIYAVKTKNSFFANWTIFAETNTMLFITFLACGGGYPWFIMPFCSMAIFPVSQYIWMHYQKPLRGLYIHAAIYLLINTMIFFIWVTNSLSCAYPWFIYPWCGWGVGLLIHYNCVVMHDKSRLFAFICADLGIMLMITFRFAIGPLFFVFLLLAFIAVVCYYLFLKKGYAAHCWCMKRKNAQATTQPDGSSPAPTEIPAPAAQRGPFAFLPQFHVQLQQPNMGYQNVVPAPPGAMYFSAGQTPFYQPGATPAPTYYAYFPGNNGQLYPSIASIPPHMQVPTGPVPVPVQSDAVLTTEVSRANAEVAKVEKGEDEEDTHLLRNSPSRSSPPSDK